MSKFTKKNLQNHKKNRRYVKKSVLGRQVKKAKGDIMRTSQLRAQQRNDILKTLHEGIHCTNQSLFMIDNTFFRRLNRLFVVSPPLLCRVSRGILRFSHFVLDPKINNVTFPAKHQDRRGLVTRLLWGPHAIFDWSAASALTRCENCANLSRPKNQSLFSSELPFFRWINRVCRDDGFWSNLASMLVGHLATKGCKGFT